LLRERGSEFSVTTSWLRDEVVVASVHGEVDIGTAAQLDEILSRLVGRGSHVVVDLSGVRFFDLTTIRVLRELQRSVGETGHRCVVVMDAWGRRVISLAGLRDELVVVATVADAVESVSRALDPAQLAE
jgi:anti-anti-sigma factor